MKMIINPEENEQKKRKEQKAEINTLLERLKANLMTPPLTEKLPATN